MPSGQEMDWAYSITVPGPTWAVQVLFMNFADTVLSCPHCMYD